MSSIPRLLINVKPSESLGQLTQKKRAYSVRFVSFRFGSFRFVSFRFVSFRFVSFRTGRLVLNQGRSPVRKKRISFFAMFVPSLSW
jgi:hypothetical protein